MVKFKLQYRWLFIALNLLISPLSQAEIELLKPAHLLSDHDQLRLTSKGSMRLQALTFDHYDASNTGQKYRRNGYSSTSRIYVNADYKINDQFNLIAGYQNFINPPKILDWQGHYQKKDQDLSTEQAYLGFSNPHYGTLKYGKIYSVYYDVVGSKTDLWDYSTLAQPQTWSPFAYHDGTQAAVKTLRYENKINNIDVYAAYLFKDHTTLGPVRYQRQSGQEIAVDIHLNKNLSWAISGKYNQAQLQSDLETDRFSQTLLASALFYFDGTWMLSAGGGWYKNLLPNFEFSAHSDSLEKFLNTEAYGLEYYAGHNFDIGHDGIEYIQPYVMGNYLKYSSGYNLSRQDHGVGVALRFNHGLGFDYERLFTRDTGHTPDMHLFRLHYEW